MNEQFKNLLLQLSTDILQQAKNGIELGSKFLGKELPLIANEIVHFGLAQAIFYTSVWFISATLLFVLTGISFKKEEKENTGEWGILGVFSFLGALGCMSGVFYNAWCIVKVATAPRLYLIEQIIKLTSAITN